VLCVEAGLHGHVGTISRHSQDDDRDAVIDKGCWP
jgi:hypothetical protein